MKALKFETVNGEKLALAKVKSNICLAHFSKSGDTILFVFRPEVAARLAGAIFEMAKRPDDRERIIASIRQSLYRKLPEGSRE